MSVPHEARLVEIDFKRSNMKNVEIAKLHPDETNPRKPDQARLALLALSIRKLGFIMPLFSTKGGMVLSGHQRLTVAAKSGLVRVPVEYLDLQT